MTPNKTLVLYVIGLLAVALAVMIPALSWLSPLTYMGILPLGAIWLWKSAGRSLWDLGYRFGPGWFRRLAGGLVFGLAIPILFLGIQAAAGWIAVATPGLPLGGLPVYLFGTLLKMGLIVAVEEFVFRGFLLSSMSQKQGFWPAALSSSLLWGLGHLSSMAAEGLSAVSMIVGMTTFLAWGIALSLCTLKTERSLWLPYGIHLGANMAFSLSGWFFVVQRQAPEWWLGHPAWAPESGLVGVVVWLILVLAIYWFPTGHDAQRQNSVL